MAKVKVSYEVEIPDKIAEEVSDDHVQEWVTFHVFSGCLTPENPLHRCPFQCTDSFSIDSELLSDD